MEDFVKADGTIVKRQRCECWSRVMGYFRPVSTFNIGKKGEFYARKYFNEGTTPNKRFTELWSNKSNLTLAVGSSS